MSTATQTHPDASTAPPAEPYGYLAEYEHVDDLLVAAARIRDAGYTQWECYSPCPIHGLDEAMGHKLSKIGWVVLISGIAGLISGLLLVWWTNATSVEGVPYALRGYAFHISGKPVFSLPANIPPIFEMTILFSAFGAFFGMLVMNLLPRFAHPVFKSDRFARATQDRFFIAIEAKDPVYHAERTEQLLAETNPLSLEKLER